MIEFRYTNWIITLREDSKPRTLVVELTTGCNYSCIHCFRFAARDFKIEFMSDDLYERLLKEAYSVGVKRLVFTGWGEPTVHPKFLDFIGETKRLGFEVVVNTNGSKLEDLAYDLVKIGVDEVYVSIDAFDLKLYSSIRRFGDLSKVTRGLLALKKARVESSSFKPVVKAILTVTRVNVSEVSKVLDYAVETGISEILVSNFIPYEGGEEGLECISDDDDCKARLEKELSILSMRTLEAGVKIFKPLTSITWMKACPFASNKALYVRVDGLVAPCLYYSRTWTTKIAGVARRINEVIIGDLRKDSLIDIWRRYARILVNLDFNRIPSCFNCEFQRYCYYTMSNEFDCLGNNPSCSHCPYLHMLSYCPI